MASSSLRSAVAPSLRASTSRSIAPLPLRHASTSPSPSSPLDTDFPLPPIQLGQTHPTRYRQHYDTTLSPALMYMSYNHRLTLRQPRPPPPEKPMTAYEINRPTPPPRLRPSPQLVTPETVPHLESIILHTYVKEAIGNKHALLSAIMALRAISGEAPQGGGRTSSDGVKVLVAKQGAAAFKLREGMPIAAKVELKGDAMYDFLQSLVDFVLPRIREYPGVALPAANKSPLNASAQSGVVSFGFPPAAMQLFPQIEANIDSYPRLHGFHVYCKTNAKGAGADHVARAVMSGFRVPFHRR